MNNLNNFPKTALILLMNDKLLLEIEKYFSFLF